MKTYKKFKKHLEKCYHLESIASLLGWDQEICMNPKALDYRANQLGHINVLSHEIFLNKKFQKILCKLNEDENLSLKQKRNVKTIFDEYQKNLKLPKKFVQKSSEVSAKAHDAWLKAKKENNFSIFKDHLKNVIDNTKEYLSLIGKQGYDALLDDFEEGLSVEVLEPIFSQIKHKLVPIVILKEEETKNAKQIKGCFPKATQKKYCLELLEKIGYDLSTGRLDESEHPFSLLISPNDSRITTNYQEDNLVSVWSALHEGGHGIYEQNLNKDEYSLPSGQALSYSIHESQSRFYEILIGKNINFWKNEFINFSNTFDLNLSLEEFIKSINKVERGTVRLEADDLSYHLHILIRYEIEKMIFDDNVTVDELPDIWRDKYKTYLGKEPENDARSIIQDTHWSGGGFGYFPTYSLGTFYAVQFFNKLNLENPDLVNDISVESLKEIKKWLNEKIHSLGSYLNAEEICEKATGERLNIQYFINFIS